MKYPPNLFIIGAPKCGTTTLHHWLSVHPQVFMTSNKEPSFFCEFTKKEWNGPGADIFVKVLVKDKDIYESLFEGSENYKWRGEASTDYLWVENVPYNIVENYGNKDKKFLVVLRNPIDRAFSEHSHLIREGMENLDFISAIQRENERYTKCWQPLFYHSRRGLYCKSLKRYFSIFGQENVKVIIFDDFKKSPKKIYKEICIFLNICENQPPLKNILNRSGIPKSIIIHKLSKRNSGLKKVIKNIIGTTKAKSLQAFVDKKNLRKNTITEKERKYIKELFIDDIKATEDLLNYDLSIWKENI